MIFTASPPAVATISQCVWDVQTVLDSNSIQRIKGVLLVNSIPVATFYNYFDTDTLTVNLEERLKPYLLSEPQSVAWYTRDLKEIQIICYEQKGGVNTGETCTSEIIYLVPGSKQGINSDRTKLWVHRKGSASISLVNHLSDSYQVTFTITAYTESGNTVSTDIRTLNAHQIGTYTVFFQNSMTFPVDAYKIKIEAIWDELTQPDLGAITYYFAPKSSFLKEIYFLNNYWAWESMHVCGSEKQTTIRKTQDFEIVNRFGNQLQRTYDEFEVITQLLSQPEMQEFTRVFNSKKLFERTSTGILKEIFFTSNSIEGKETDEEMKPLKFNYRYADVQS